MLDDTYPDIRSTEELRESVKRFRNGTLVTLGILGVGALCWMDYKNDQSQYQAELEAAKGIPALERAHNYRDAQTAEDEGWSYISRARKDGFHVSEKQLKDLSKLLNENNTSGTPRGQPLK